MICFVTMSTSYSDKSSTSVDTDLSVNYRYELEELGSSSDEASPCQEDKDSRREGAVVVPYDDEPIADEEWNRKHEERVRKYEERVRKHKERVREYEEDKERKKIRVVPTSHWIQCCQETCERNELEELGSSSDEASPCQEDKDSRREGAVVLPYDHERIADEEWNRKYEERVRKYEERVRKHEERVRKHEERVRKYEEDKERKKIRVIPTSDCLVCLESTTEAITEATVAKNAAKRSQTAKVDSVYAGSI